MKRGFTIIELLVAITIIGILISAASLAFGRARSTSRDARRMSDILLMGKAIDDGASQNGGVYPYIKADLTYGDTPSTQKIHSSVDCLDELVTSTIVAYSLNAALLPKNTTPFDPLPAGPRYSFACVFPQEGYIYENHYIDKVHYPVVSSDNIAQYSMAQTVGTDYVLDFGLENELPDNQTFLFKQYSDVQKKDPHATFTYSDGNIFYTDPTVSGKYNKRYYYYLPGPYCGTTCYN